MPAASQPLVCVITPVFNTAKYLPECIESVLAQTYSNWTYVIVDNRSTDPSRQIAEAYAKRHERIRVVANDTHLDMIANWNHALDQLSADSRYCKVLHADDWIMPQCIDAMVALGEKHPAAGIIGSYRLEENHVDLDGLPHSQNVYAGKDICRRSLLDWQYFFGSPSTLLFRSELIRQNKPFYDDAYIHADNEVCYRLLKNTDFGFVHQVLSFTRRHNETNTTYTKRMNTFILEKLKIIREHGPDYLSDAELDKLYSWHLQRYYRRLGAILFKSNGRDFWRYHKEGLQSLGHQLSVPRLLLSSGVVAYNKLLDRLKRY